MTASGSQLRNAAVLGSVSGARTLGAWTGLALSGRVTGRARIALLVAAAGEIAADKLPMMPPRSDPPALAGRIVSGALAGRIAGGAHGAGIGAATAAATTYASERARALLGAHTSLPDPVLALLEDAVVVGLAVVAARPPAPEPPAAPAAPPSPEHESVPEPRRSPAGAIARGLVAGAAGTAAMTSVQYAYLRLSGGEPSSAPGDVGRRLLAGVADRKVPRRRRPAFNQAMHVLYGTAWGGPFGLLDRSRPSGGRSALLGAGFGTAVWATSLVHLPLLGIAPPPWRQSASSLLPDLAFHLVYGTTTAMVHGALTA